MFTNFVVIFSKFSFTNINSRLAALRRYFIKSLLRMCVLYMYMLCSILAYGVYYFCIAAYKLSAWLRFVSPLPLLDQCCHKKTEFFLLFPSPPSLHMLLPAMLKFRYSTKKYFNIVVLYIFKKKQVACILFKISVI